LEDHSIEREIFSAWIDLGKKRKSFAVKKWEEAILALRLYREKRMT
jgi:hypothetical protein